MRCNPQKCIDNETFKIYMCTVLSWAVEPLFLAGSDSEESDSDLSDVGSLDSDLEQEQEKTYDKCVCVGRHVCTPTGCKCVRACVCACVCVRTCV